MNGNTLTTTTTTTTTTDTGTDSSSSAAAEARKKARKEAWDRLKAGTEPREPVLVEATCKGTPCEFLGDATFAVLGFDRGEDKRYARDVLWASYDPFKKTEATDSGDEDSGDMDSGDSEGEDSGDEDSGDSEGNDSIGTDSSGEDSDGESTTETRMWFMSDSDGEDDEEDTGDNYPDDLKSRDALDIVPMCLLPIEVYRKVTVAETVEAAAYAPAYWNRPSFIRTQCFSAAATSAAGTSASSSSAPNHAGAAQAAPTNGDARTGAANGVDTTSDRKEQKESEESLKSHIKRAAHRSRRL